MDDYLSKPFEASMLLRMIGRLMPSGPREPAQQPRQPSARPRRDGTGPTPHGESRFSRGDVVLEKGTRRRENGTAPFGGEDAPVPAEGPPPIDHHGSGPLHGKPGVAKACWRISRATCRARWIKSPAPPRSGRPGRAESAHALKGRRGYPHRRVAAGPGRPTRSGRDATATWPRRRPWPSARRRGSLPCFQFGGPGAMNSRGRRQSLKKGMT